jgi:hypothetical protein
VSAVAFVVPGRPVTWQRGVKGIRFDARGKLAKEYREKVGLLALQAIAHARRAGVVWPDVKDHRPTFRVDVAGWWPDAVEGDEDRMVSLVRDALEGVLYKTDRQVKASHNGVGCPSSAHGIVVVVRVLDADAREAWATSVMDDARAIMDAERKAGR